MLAQALWVTAQVVAERESWVRGQCERLEELSQELDCVKGLAWPRKAMGTQGEAKEAGGWATGEGGGKAGPGGRE